jgi:homoserine O-succinyltransferase
MPVVAHPKLPSLARLEQEGVVLSTATGTDFSKELHVGLLNLMPDAALQATERQFIRLLASDAQILVHVYPTTVAAVTRSKASMEYIAQHYNKIEAFFELALDGLIISGANPSRPDMSEEPFWKPLINVAQWAEEHTNSVLCSCLATHALTKYYFGIDRERRQEKSWGLFSHRLLNPSHPLTDGLQEGFMGPHSHYYDLSSEKIEQTDLEILAEHDEAGFFVATTADTRLVFCQGHPEYDDVSLFKEYKREIDNYLSVFMSGCPPRPTNYFSKEGGSILRDIQQKVVSERSSPQLPEKELLEQVEVKWQDSGKILYKNWLEILLQKKHSAT